MVHSGVLLLLLGLELLLIAGKVQRSVISVHCGRLGTKGGENETLKTSLPSEVKVTYELYVPFT